LPRHFQVEALEHTLTTEHPDDPLGGDPADSRDVHLEQRLQHPAPFAGMTRIRFDG
jgi:hypothetical protein